MWTCRSGWFKKAVKSPDDLKGVRYRGSGLTGDLFAGLGASIVNVPGKPKRRGQVSGFRPGYKKAIIQLRAGDSIELFEGAR